MFSNWAALAEKQIKQAILKREKTRLSEIIVLDSEIKNLKRDINQELLLLSQEEIHELDIETDDTQQNRLTHSHKYREYSISH